MKLKELNARFYGGRTEAPEGWSKAGEEVVEYDGVSFVCPCGQPEHAERRIAISFSDWKATGATIETLTLHPSIRIMDVTDPSREHWHGWIKNGEVVPV